MRSADEEFVEAYGKHMDAQALIEIVGSPALREAVRKTNIVVMQIHQLAKHHQFDQIGAKFVELAAGSEELTNACRAELGFGEKPNE
jgi:hypothetical protein